MPTNAEHTTWTVWRDFDPGGAWAGVGSDTSGYGTGTRTVDLRLTTTPTPSTTIGYGTSGQVAIELTSLDAYTFTTSDGVDVTDEVAATISQQWMLVLGPAGGGVNYGPLQLQINNALDRPVFLTAASGQARYRQRDPTFPEVTTPTPTTTGPTSTLPTGVPVDVLERIAREKANPGFTCKLTFYERYDLLGVEIGDKVALTITELGMVARGHVVTRITHHFDGALLETRAPGLTLTSTFTLEKIPGTVLPGAGTSTPEQDDAWTGAEISAYLRFDETGSGFGSGVFDPS